ncbi:MAG TPA: glycosyltransferase family 2 protein [Candidatus Baltobacteraceae bacterium]|nr:glycosyltransferase family 2 protein [Candidatus Baltobacteraceae bacterium]
MLDVVPCRATSNVAAIVLNWNGWRDTVECLESLMASTHRPSHIVVCDNGSVDGSLGFLKQWAAGNGIAYESFDSSAEALASPAHGANLMFIQNGENRGFAAGNNVGLRYVLERTRADYCWILNNDAVVSPEALESMLEIAQEDPSAGMVGCTLVNYDQPHVVQAIGGGYIVPVVCHDTQLGRGTTRRQAVSRRIELEHLIGACLLVRTQAIRDVGLMDESYFLYREETDWCIRMRRQGWRLFCSPDATVRHKQARSVGFKSPMHDYYAVRNILRLVQKFFPKSLPFAFGYFAMRSLLPKLVRLQLTRTLAVCAALRDFVAGVEGRSAAHSDATMHAHYLRELNGSRPVFAAQPPRVNQKRVAVLAAGLVLALAMLLGRVALTPSSLLAFAVVKPRRAIPVVKINAMPTKNLASQRSLPVDQGN